MEALWALREPASIEYGHGEQSLVAVNFDLDDLTARRLPGTTDARMPIAGCVETEWPVVDSDAEHAPARRAGGRNRLGDR